MHYQRVAGSDPANQTKLVCIGGSLGKFSAVYIHPFNMTAEVNYPDFPVSSIHHAAVIFNNVLYCIGGCHNLFEFSRQDFALTLGSNVLKCLEKESLHGKRSRLGAAVFQGHIVVTGSFVGFIDNSIANTVETFCSKTNT